MDFKALVSQSEGWCSVEKMEKMVEEARLALLDSGDSFTGIELGVFAGRSVIPIADLLHSENVSGMIYGIDPWATAEATKGYSEENEKWWREVNLPDFLKQSHELVRKYGLHRYVTLITSTSDDAAVLFRGVKLDYLHIDGQHVFEQFKRDVDNYVPLCRPSAPIIVDDVGWVGGSQASEYISKLAEYKYSVGDCGFFVKR